MHRVFADTERRGQLAATPVRNPSLGFLRDGRQDAGRKAGVSNWASAGMIGVQSSSPYRPEALLPAER